MEPISSVSPKHKYIILILAVVVVALGFLSGFLLLRSSKQQDAEKTTSSPSAVQGILDINGVIPGDSSLDIVVTDKSGRQNTISSGVVPLDANPWSYPKATPGESYTIQAILMQNGQKLGVSNPVTVTAPASDVVLTMNIESQASGSANAIITGDIIVNGYIPSGATITIQGRRLGNQQFTTVASGLTGAARQIMTYTTAQEGTTYEVQGILYAANGTQIGSSSLLTVTAPAAHEELVINSSAQAPSATPAAGGGASPTAAPATTSISGNINLNGVAQANTRIVILQKNYNAQNYQVAVDNVQPVNGATWTWNGATSSQWYDLIAVLKQRQSNGSDIDVAKSSMTSVAAPASNVGFIINTGFSLGAPTNTAGINCTNQSGSSWTGVLSFNPQNSAASVWYQVGSSSGGSDIANATANVYGNNPVTANVTLTNGATYYLQYAYSTQANLSPGNNQFSPFSSVQQIRCG